MDDITNFVIEKYLVDRKTAIESKGKTGRGIATETSALVSVFKMALEEGLIQSSPIRCRPKLDAPMAGAMPFSPQEILKLEEVEKSPAEELVYLMFRRTGLRCSDVADIRWSAVNWETKIFTWRTKKRGREVILPIIKDLYELLRDMYLGGDGPILSGYRENKLYNTIQKIGSRAGVLNCHPHRFRDTFAVDLLAKGGTIYDVAKLLGITVHTAETHYAEFTSQLQEKVRNLLESVI